MDRLADLGFVELGKQILDESGLNIVSASDMKDGATKILEATSA